MKLNSVQTQLAKWRKNGIKNTPYGAFHDVVGAGDIVEYILTPDDLEQCATEYVQREAKKIWPSIHIKQDCKGGWIWTAVKTEVERVMPGSAVSKPHWRGFVDTMPVKDTVRESTKFVALTIKRIIESRPV